MPLEHQAWRREELSPQHLLHPGHYVNKKGQERVYYGKEKLPHRQIFLASFPACVVASPRSWKEGHQGVLAVPGIGPWLLCSIPLPPDVATTLFSI